MIILGLSGGAGSGKTTVAELFRRVCQARIFNADKEVHIMYESDLRIIKAAEENFPDAVFDGKVSREKLSRHFYAHDDNWKGFQHIVHKRLFLRQEKFILGAMRDGIRYLVLDVPLLLEEGFGAACDAIIHVHVNRHTQWKRLRMRGLSDHNIRFILSLQFDEDRRRNFADFTLNTAGRASEISGSIMSILGSLPARG